MKKNFKGSSLVEVMVIMLIMLTGVTGMYTIYSNSQKLSDNLDMKIQAIQIAREGIEAMTNIRDTNWKMFSTDIKNCWNTYNYDVTCINDTGTTSEISNGSYKIFQNPADNRWRLNSITANETNDYSIDSYRNDYRVYTTDMNGEGFYTQQNTGNETIFTREIIVAYFNPDKTGDNYDPNLPTDSNGEFMKITSKVMWKDSSRQEPYTVKFETFLSNHKALN